MSMPEIAHNTARQRVRAIVSIRSALASAAAIFAGVLIAVAGTTGSYALWNGQSDIANASINTGSLTLTVKFGSGAAGSTAAIPTAAWAGLLPGDFVGQEITVANTGTTFTNITGRLGATSAYDIRIAAGACPATLLSNAALTTTAVSVGSLAAGGSSVACVQVSLPLTAPASAQGTTTPFTITLDGTQ
jgi:hypothetical protein